MIFLLHLVLTEVIQRQSAGRLGESKMVSLTHLAPCGDVWKAGLSKDCPLSASMWPVHHGGFGVVRILTWQLRAPKVSVPANNTAISSFVT